MAIHIEQVGEAIAAYANDLPDFGPRPEGIDWNKAPETQTEKAKVKVLPCTVCARPLVVSTFYTPAWAKCSECTPEKDTPREVGSATVVQAGRTDPSLAADLGACLINRVEFEVMACPFGHGDMELKSVNHNDRYGPTKMVGYEKGQPLYKQYAPGETTMHQCNECRCVVTMSTTAVNIFKRQNEPRQKEGSEANAWSELNGTREKG